jgi:hypothetical protein
LTEFEEKVDLVMEAENDEKVSDMNTDPPRVSILPLEPAVFFS